ncbi:MAG: hypothetical protein MUE79_08230, partial [Nitratireductor sp.]|nr:hypothetical protein [Nitratireductor sp.]
DHEEFGLDVDAPELVDEPFAEPSPEPALADLQIDFEGELERSLGNGQPEQIDHVELMEPAAPASLESELTAELSDDLDFAKLLGEQEEMQAVPTITTPEPQQRRQEKVDDEMQRLLEELANA